MSATLFENAAASLRKLGKNEVYLILTPIFFLPGIILFVLFIIPVYIFRVVVTLLAKWLRPDLGICMGGLTNTLLVNDWFSEKAPRGTIVVPMVVNGILIKEQVEKTVLQTWIHGTESGIKDSGRLKYPQFHQYPFKWLGFTFWKNDKNFDIKKHVFCHTPASFGVPSGEIVDEHVDELVEKLLNARYPPESSPWELHIVQYYKNPQFQEEPMSVLILRVHHCLADGYSILAAIVEGLCGTPMYTLNMPKPRYPKRSWIERLIYLGTFPFVGLYELWQILKHSFIDCPWKIEDSNKEWYQYTGKAKLIPMDKVKKIKHNLGVSFTSVLLSAISAGISSNLERKKRQGKVSSFKSKDEDSAPTRSMFCMSTLPLNLNSRMDRLANIATGAAFHIPADFHFEPLERLKECDKMLENTKKSVIPHVAFLFFDILGGLFTKVASFLGRNRFIATGLTNFPALPKDANVCLNGKKALFAEFTLGCLEGVGGVGFIVISCYPYIRLAVSAEKAVLSREEVNDLIKVMEQEINKLYSLATNFNSIKEE